MDSEILELEQRPTDKELLASVFRTIHTIKGTCGFLGFPLLERIAHQAESFTEPVAFRRAPAVSAVGIADSGMRGCHSQDSG
ncbi:MAG: Hpt domain-containing protein [Ignavibacteriota bacterium]